MDEVPDTAQHFIECDTETCRNFSEFYCNTCHQRVCPQCKQRHLEQNNGHEIVRYQERKKKLPSEKCRIHPTEELNVFCYDCQDPVCSICFAQHHSHHEKSDLETIYNDILQQCQKEITNIWKTDIPGAKDRVNSIGKKRDNVKKEIANLRASMKKRADELKKTVDSILTDNNKKLDEIENSILNDIGEQQKETEDDIKYLEKMIADFESKISSITHTELMKFQLDIALATLKMPRKSEPKLPTLTFGPLNREEIAKQFGEIEQNLSEIFKLTSITKFCKVIPIQEPTFHLSLLSTNKFWATDDFGNIILYDLEGNILHKIFTKIMLSIRGFHTVTTEGELLYTDYREKTVYRVTNGMFRNKLITTGSWGPGAIYSSPINGHILVGMERILNNKITRYNKEGRKLLDMQWDDLGKNLYQSIDYITENINGDICTSDNSANKVLVVTKSGEYRFSYSGHHSQAGFHPYGICTDKLGNILVCNSYKMYNGNCYSIHLLDINGQFLTLLLTPDQCPPHPRALCIDGQHNFWVGGLRYPTVYVYKYMRNTKI